MDLSWLNEVNWWPLIAAVVAVHLFSRMMRQKMENRIKNPKEYCDFITIACRIKQCGPMETFKEAGEEITGISFSDSKLNMDVNDYLKSRGKKVPKYVVDWVDAHREDLLDAAEWVYNYDGEDRS